ncbi:hypothetical protein ACVDG8_020575 [Mesorhizobium sp. ORM8.1]
MAAAAFAVGCQAASAVTKQAGSEMDKCIASARVWDITFKHELASFMGEPLDRVPALFCQRIFEAVRTGRISFSDVNAIQLNQPTEIWKVIKGNSRGSNAARGSTRRAPKYRSCTGIDGAFQVPASKKCPLSGYAHDGY